MSNIVIMLTVHIMELGSMQMIQNQQSTINNAINQYLMEYDFISYKFTWLTGSKFDVYLYFVRR